VPLWAKSALAKKKTGDYLRPLFHVSSQKVSYMLFHCVEKKFKKTKMDGESLQLCAAAGLVDAPYIRAATQARAQRQALIKNLLSHVRPIFYSFI
jgi:hypothetical protein